jgi:hypothetical protein
MVWEPSQPNSFRVERFTLTQEKIMKQLVEAVKTVLRHLGDVLVTFASKKKLMAFTFETREGLYVEEAVITLLGKVVTVPTQSNIKLGKHALNVKANDTTITDEFKPGYIFKETENGKELLKWVIASLILAQWGGVKGTLLNNGYANIFYFERADGVRFAVRIFWNSGNREWGVDLWLFGGSGWNAGRVVFSRN